MLSEACDNGKLLAVFAECIKLVCEGSLELFSSDVGELGFGDEGFRFSTDKFLFKDDNSWRVRLLIFQLRNLISNLLFA